MQAELSAYKDIIIFIKIIKLHLETYVFVELLDAYKYHAYRPC